MSINWVMLSENKSFVPLPGEQILHTSPQRTALSLQSLTKYPGKTFSLQSSAGMAWLTNRRVIYLPASPTPQLQSFAAPILNLHDTHVTAPFFGPNVWTAVAQPVPGGGIPAQHPALELKLTFKEGGAFDFHQKYERIKERLHQAMEVATERSPSGNTSGGVDMDNVFLDELPAYSEAASTLPITAPSERMPSSRAPVTSGESVVEADDVPLAQPVSHRAEPQDQFNLPAEPPPGYDEVQRSSVADELERQLRRRDTEVGGHTEYETHS